MWWYEEIIVDPGIKQFSKIFLHLSASVGIQGHHDHKN